MRRGHHQGVEFELVAAAGQIQTLHVHEVKRDAETGQRRGGRDGGVRHRRAKRRREPEDPVAATPLALRTRTALPSAPRSSGARANMLTSL